MPGKYRENWTTTEVVKEMLRDLAKLKANGNRSLTMQLLVIDACEQAFGRPYVEGKLGLVSDTRQEEDAGV